MPQFGMPGRGKSFSWLHDSLSEEHTVINTDLKNGHVPEEADILLVAAPEAIDNKQLFAIDQFLMRGGTVILSTSPFDIDLDEGLSATAQNSGLKDWLAFHGLTMDHEMVLDPQNSAFPIPVKREVGGFVIQETQMVDYPYLVDIRPEGMNQTSGMLAGLNQVTMSWVDLDKNHVHKVVRLLESSAASWLSDSTDIQPDYQGHGRLGFAQGKAQPAKQLLGVEVEGSFSSFFKDKA